VGERLLLNAVFGEPSPNKRPGLGKAGAFCVDPMCVSSRSVGSERAINVPMTPPIATSRGRSSGDQTIPREQLFVIAAMKLDHFPTMDDPCIRTGNKANTLGEKNGRKN